LSEAAAAPSKPSLRALLLRRVMVPLVLTWAVGTAIALAVANHFAGQAFDRSLLDDAYALAAQVRFGPQGLAVSLTQREMSTLLFDQSESVYLAVYDAQGRLAAGNPDLPQAPLGEQVNYQLSDIVYRGRELRAVSLRRGQPTEFVVVMAQTTGSRSRLLRRLLGYSAVPQVLLLVFLAWQLRRVIQRDLEPLAQLQQAVNQRDASDLRPVPRAAGDRPELDALPAGSQHCGPARVRGQRCARTANAAGGYPGPGRLRAGADRPGGLA
jgi:two-component system sensor histidine kinase TctE